MIDKVVLDIYPSYPISQSISDILNPRLDNTYARPALLTREYKKEVLFAVRQAVKFHLRHEILPIRNYTVKVTKSADILPVRKQIA